MVNDDDWSMYSSRVERFERWCHQEVLKAWQGSDLREETCVLI